MTTLLNVSPDSLGDAPKLHLIPAEVHCDGPANVKSYFESTIRESADHKFTASLRGRPIHGMEFEVPSGYTGLIFNETRKAYTDEDERELSATRNFKSFTYWNLDREPTVGDRLQQAKQWIDIASALHTLVDVDLKKENSVGSLKSEVSM